MNADAELAVLEKLYSSGKEGGSSSPTQRSLARDAGLSLGMTNVLLKRLSEKGWVTVKRLNSRNLHYALTPEGVQEIARRTYRYLRRTARNASLYRDILEEFVLKARQNGVHTLVLAGVSDLDFMLEYVCDRHGLVFLKTVDPRRAEALRGDGVFILRAERVLDEPESIGDLGLKDLLAGRPIPDANEERQ